MPLKGVPPYSRQYFPEFRCWGLHFPRGDEPVYARLHGIVRGMLQEGVPVKKGLKIGDVDARIEGKLCYTISDKARKIGNGVAEAIDLVYKTK